MLLRKRLSGKTNYSIVKIMFYFIFSCSLTNDEVNFRKGEEYSFLVTSLENLGEIKSFTLSWVPSATVDCSPTDCDLYVANISMSALNNYPEA